MSETEHHGSNQDPMETIPAETARLTAAGGGKAVEGTGMTEPVLQRPESSNLGSNLSSKGSHIEPIGHVRDEVDPDVDVSEAAGKLVKLHLDMPPSYPQAKDTKHLPASPPPPQPPSETEKAYLDPTPKTPVMSRRPSAAPSDEEETNEKTPQYMHEPGASLTNNTGTSSDGDKESASEIQSIMDQFANESGAPTKEEIMSPKNEGAGPMLSIAGQYPPRKSSLEPLRSRDMDQIASSPIATTSERFPSSPPPVPPKPELTPVKSSQHYALTSGSTSSLHSLPPPPEPDPDLPFDFHRFLEQLRHKSADPVAKFLRSFLTEFGKKQWMVHEQVKIISDFLAFITNKMALCDIWREVSDAEFDNAKEGMEKLVMNRLYSQTFSPAIPPQAQPPRPRGKRTEAEKVVGPGRKGQHQEDVERDEILAQKIRIYSWVREEHLDISSVGQGGERFLKMAQQELLKIKGYRAPRDKVICVLNCCKVIFGFLKNAKSSDTSADSFVPLLIYVVLQANPEHLVSNIQYILRFRNQDKLGGEAGYYLSSLSGAIQFIEGLDRTTLDVSDEEFERNVELAVSAIAEQNREAEVASSSRQQFSEKSGLAEPELTPRNSLDVFSTSPGKGTRAGRPSDTATSDSVAAEDGVSGLLRTIQRPLSAIGRILSDSDTRPDSRNGPSMGSQQTTQARLSPSVFQPPASSTEERRSHSQIRVGEGNVQSRIPVRSYDAQEAAARQASAEAAEAQRVQQAEHRNVVETLYGMFPNLDKEVIDDVVRQKEGRVGLAVDACLALTAGG